MKNLIFFNVTLYENDNVIWGKNGRFFKRLCYGVMKKILINFPIHFTQLILICSPKDRKNPSNLNLPICDINCDKLCQNEEKKNQMKDMEKDTDKVIK